MSDSKRIKTVFKHFDTPFILSSIVTMIVQLYQEGMAIEDIGMCINNMSIQEVNWILDRVVPYLL
jgi:hypothetical protein